MMRRSGFGGLLLIAFVLAGCGGNPPMPAGFVAAQAVIDPGSGDTELNLDGSSGRLGGAAGGGAKGAGVGVLAGAAACGPALFLFPVCVGSVMVVGALTGAAVGAYKAESSEEIETKRALLKSAVDAADLRGRLAARLASRSAIVPGAELPVLATGTSASQGWTVRLLAQELSTTASGSWAPFALQLTTELEIARAGQASREPSRVYRSASAQALSTAGWADQAGAPLRAALETLLEKQAESILRDLAAARR